MLQPPPQLQCLIFSWISFVVEHEINKTKLKEKKKKKIKEDRTLLISRQIKEKNQKSTLLAFLAKRNEKYRISKKEKRHQSAHNYQRSSRKDSHKIGKTCWKEYIFSRVVCHRTLRSEHIWIYKTTIRNESCWQIISKKRRGGSLSHLILFFISHVTQRIAALSCLLTKQPILFSSTVLPLFRDGFAIVFLFFFFFLIFLFPGSRGTVESRDVSLDDRLNTSMRREKSEHRSVRRSLLSFSLIFRWGKWVNNGWRG